MLLSPTAPDCSAPEQAPLPLSLGESMVGGGAVLSLARIMLAPNMDDDVSSLLSPMGLGGPFHPHLYPSPLSVSF